MIVMHIWLHCKHTLSFLIPPKISKEDKGQGQIDKGGPSP